MYAQVRCSGESLTNYVALLWIKVSQLCLKISRKGDDFLCLALISVCHSELPALPMFCRACRTYLSYEIRLFRQQFRNKVASAVRGRSRRDNTLRFAFPRGNRFHTSSPRIHLALRSVSTPTYNQSYLKLSEMQF